MARLCYVLVHSTNEPERTAAALEAARAAAEGGRDVALWLTGEGVRLGVTGVAEAIRPAGHPEAAPLLESIVAAGGALHCVRTCFERRDLDTEALRPGASLVAVESLADLIDDGWTLVPT